MKFGTTVSTRKRPRNLRRGGRNCTSFASLTSVRFPAIRIQGLSITEMLLHSSPPFLELTPPDCESVDVVKERIFREYDSMPQDGRLDENEVREVFLQHDVDTSSLKYIIPESKYFIKKGGIMLNDFTTSSALPLACSGLSLTKSSDIFFTSILYQYGF